MDLDEVLALHSKTLCMIGEALKESTGIGNTADKVEAVTESLDTLKVIIRQIEERIPVIHGSRMLH